MRFCTGEDIRSKDMAKDKKFGKGFFCGILTSAVVVLAGSGVLQQGGWMRQPPTRDPGAAPGGQPARPRNGQFAPPPPGGQDAPPPPME